MTRRAVLAAVTYVAVIVAANWLTDTFGLVTFLGITVTAGTYAAAAALIARDWVQVTAGRAAVVALIVVGAALSYLTSTPALALASGLAFLVSELVDTAVFTPLRKRSLALAVIVSSLAAAPVDTVLFLNIAGFPVTRETVAAQVVVKTAMAGVVALVLARRRPA